MKEIVRNYMAMTLAVVAFTVGLILIGAPNSSTSYAYATLKDRVQIPHFPGRYAAGGGGSRWRLELLDQTSTIRSNRLLHSVSAGDVICVAFTDHWPEGLLVVEQVAIEAC